jgi:hypothetical protein
VDALLYFLKFCLYISGMLGIVFVISAGVFGSWRGAWGYMRTLVGFLAAMAAIGSVLAFGCASVG